MDAKQGAADEWKKWSKKKREKVSIPVPAFLKPDLWLQNRKDDTKEDQKFALHPHLKKPMPDTLFQEHLLRKDGAILTPTLRKGLYGDIDALANHQETNKALYQLMKRVTRLKTLLEESSSQSQATDSKSDDTGRAGTTAFAAMQTIADWNETLVKSMAKSFLEAPELDTMLTEALASVKKLDTSIVSAAHFESTWSVALSAAITELLEADLSQEIMSKCAHLALELAFLRGSQADMISVIGKVISLNVELPMSIVSNVHNCNGKRREKTHSEKKTEAALKAYLQGQGLSFDALTSKQGFKEPTKPLRDAVPDSYFGVFDAVKAQDAKTVSPLDAAASVLADMECRADSYAPDEVESQFVLGTPSLLEWTTS
jgi:hypothetical protein